MSEYAQIIHDCMQVENEMALVTVDESTSRVSFEDSNEPKRMWVEQCQYCLGYFCTADEYSEGSCVFLVQDEDQEEHREKKHAMDHVFGHFMPKDPLIDHCNPRSLNTLQQICIYCFDEFVRKHIPLLIASYRLSRNELDQQFVEIGVHMPSPLLSIILEYSSPLFVARNKNIPS